MIALQTKLILGTLATLANLVPHSSTTGIVSFSFSLDVIVSSNLPQIIVSCLKTFRRILEVWSQWILSMGLCASRVACI